MYPLSYSLIKEHSLCSDFVVFFLSFGFCKRVIFAWTNSFNPLELIARIKSQLRRSDFNKAKKTKDKNEYIHKGLYLNTITREVKINNEEVTLTPTEFEILKLLLINKGNVMRMDKIYEEVWGNDFMDSKNTVMVHIRKLREKIELDPKNPDFIKTIWGVGYKIEK